MIISNSIIRQAHEFLDYHRKKAYQNIILISNNSFDKNEDKRCGGLWNPLSQEEFSNKSSIYKFENLNDESFINHLISKEYKIGIQGGTGILKKIHLNSFYKA